MDDIIIKDPKEIKELFQRAVDDIVQCVNNEKPEYLKDWNMANSSEKLETLEDIKSALGLSCDLFELITREQVIELRQIVDEAKKKI